MTTQNPQYEDSIQNERDRNFETSLPNRHKFDQIFAIATWIATLLGLVVLAILLFDVFTDGLQRLSWGFLTNFPSRIPEDAGIVSALVGSIWLLILTTLIAFPVGVGAGIFLEEYATNNWFSKVVEINIANLAAVPSIIYGLLGLQVFVRWLEPITKGRTIITGGLTLALLVMPIIIVATREALRSVPGSLRQAGFGLGATRWQVIRELVFPVALPGILTGTILALSRAIGETAPLITIGALTYIAFLPRISLQGLQSPFTALPIQIYNWVSRPQSEFHMTAAAGIIVLMVVLVLMNATAIFLRNKFQKNR
ncbi:MAG: phosphate ABC transporter permease PstA [Rivularia sp. T60_A2020_040]|nr:phosphate ABC transporter permease PstA [Rivularia sp. T60_A2020_040]